jgi:ammonium transporter, Amt family
MDPGDTAWMMVSTALVLFMIPGLALFYGGMVRSKNVLGMMMQNFMAMGVVAVLWALLGFTLAFGALGNGGFIGNFDFIGLRDIGIGPSAPELDMGLTIPLVLFAAFQMTFAIITPALITGASADRMKFGPFTVFISVWLLLVYTPVAHWVWGGGWLDELGALDFAGGAVVHINAGAAALALVLVLGRRRGWPHEQMPPHNLPFTMLGAAILWLGWFGFNAGSALAADGIAAQALMNTFLAGSSGMLGWLAVERIRSGHPTTLGAASGVIAGLVAITPCAGYVGGLAGIAIGAIAGAVCYLAIGLKTRFGFDDSLDVVAVHLVGGLVGSLLLGFFADTAATGDGRDGLFFGGGAGLLGDQFVASFATMAFSFVVAYVIAKVLDTVMGIRVSEDDELTGLDLTQHAETAYSQA